MPKDSQFEAIKVSLGRAHVETLQNTAINIQGDLVVANPKDTGWSSSNWNFGVGHAPTVLKKDFDKSAPRAPQLSRARERQLGSLRALFKMVIPQDVYISNHVSYVPILDKKGSVKSGVRRGWIRRAIRSGLAKTGIGRAGFSVR